jgi:DNA polymerase-3 subunit beta
MCGRRDDVTFTSKLIDGRFPDYEAVIPIGADKEVKVDREVLRAALQRAAILSNEKYRGVKRRVSPRPAPHQRAQPRAGRGGQRRSRPRPVVDGLSIGFNVNYLLDALGALREDQVSLNLRDANSSALVREAGHNRSRHVVMPLRL